MTSCTEIAQRVGDAIRAHEGGNPTVSVVRFGASETRLHQRDSFSGIVLTDTGLARPPSQDVDDFAAEISPERIPDADADHIHVAVFASESAQQIRERFNANRCGRSSPVTCTRSATAPTTARPWTMCCSRPGQRRSC